MPLTLPKRDAKKPNVISRLAHPRLYSSTWLTRWLKPFRRMNASNLRKLMTTEVDIAALSKAMTDAMVKNFTTEELKALADFYGSPVGKSAMKKFGAYMADIMPVVQPEIMKAAAKMEH